MLTIGCSHFLSGRCFGGMRCIVLARLKAAAGFGGRSSIKYCFAESCQASTLASMLPCPRLTDRRPYCCFNFATDTHCCSARPGGPGTGDSGEGGADNRQVPPARAGGHPAGEWAVPEREAGQGSCCKLVPTRPRCNYVNRKASALPLAGLLCDGPYAGQQCDLAAGACPLRRWRRHATLPSCACCASWLRRVQPMRVYQRREDWTGF